MVSGVSLSLCFDSCKDEGEALKADEKRIATSAEEPLLQFGIHIPCLVMSLMCIDVISKCIDVISKWCEGCRVSL